MNWHSRENEKPALPEVSGEYYISATPPSWWRRGFRAVINWCRRHPVVAIYVLIIAVNLIHTVFNILYNNLLIHNNLMNEAQKNIFWTVAIPIYNAFIYPFSLIILFFILKPLRRVHKRILAEEKITEKETASVQRLLVDLPFIYVCWNSFGWLGAAFFFPLVICWLGGSHNAEWIWLQFLLSFTVGTLATVVQIYFALEEFLIRILYPLYFRNARPANVRGRVPKFSFLARLTLLFLAVAGMPMLALFLVAFNYASGANSQEGRTFAAIVFFIGILSSGAIYMAMARGLFRWLKGHQVATEELAHGHLQYRIPERRPDEWGKLTDNFNDMAESLEKAELMRETFGQVVHPSIRDAIMERYHGTTGEVCDITVLFSDIRGFTRRSAGEPPAKVFALLNRFMTMAVQAVEGNGGFVDKFLGDGVMALFGLPFPPPPRADHADIALDAAREMLSRLQDLNEELTAQGETPLTIGIGIHTGPAQVGCPGATIQLEDGAITYRRSFTAIGETVNLSQRMEQFTKTLEGPILISEQTRQSLQSEPALRCLGEHDVPGYDGKLKVHQVLPAK